MNCPTYELMNCPTYAETLTEVYREFAKVCPYFNACKVQGTLTL